MDITTAIRSRRTIRDFKQDPIDMDVLLSILQDASWAPNHRLCEPWKLKMIVGDAKARLAEEIIESYTRLGLFAKDTEEQIKRYCGRLREFGTTVPVHLIVYMDVDADIVKYEEDFAAVCTYMQNVQLLGWEHNIGALWASSPYIYDSEFKQRMDIESDQKIIGVLHLGYANKVPKARRRTAIKEKLQIISQ